LNYRSSLAAHAALHCITDYGSFSALPWESFIKWRCLLKKAESKSTRKGVLGKQERFEVMHELKERFSIRTLVKVAQVSRAGYYKWLQTKGKRVERSEEDAILKEHILSIYRTHPYYGYRRIRTALRREGIVMNQKKVRRLMRELGIRSFIRKKRPFYGRKASVVFPNVLEQNFTASRSMEKLATDITYICIGDSFVYLSTVIDLFNNEVVAWAMSKRNDLALVHTTLKHLMKRGSLEGVILHSDQGSQYTSKSYAKSLKALG
jgi:putative transposase